MLKHITILTKLFLKKANNIFPLNNKNLILPNLNKKNIHKLIISNYFSFSNSMETLKYKTKEDIFNLLKNNNVSYHLEDHEKLDTVQEALQKLKTDKYKPEEYTFLKNLFLRNKKGGYILLTAHNV